MNYTEVMESLGAMIVPDENNWYLQWEFKGIRLGCSFGNNPDSDEPAEQQAQSILLQGLDAFAINIDRDNNRAINMEDCWDGDDSQLG